MPKYSNLLTQWQLCTRNALQRHQARSAGTAYPDYQQALRLAQRLIDTRCDSPESETHMACYVISHLNLAECCTDLHYLGAARQWLERARRYLLDCIDNAPTQAIQIAALRHLREVLHDSMQLDDVSAESQEDDLADSISDIGMPSTILQQANQRH